jgi:UDP-N-acetylglucosamine acyltransferase
MSAIDPTARVDGKAVIGPDVSIGPYCVVGPHVTVGEGCRLVAHVHVAGHTAIGARTTIAPFVSLGTAPQSVRYRGGATRLIVGEACDIREHVTMNTGTEDGGGVTRVGDRCFFMVGSHVGHDCIVGSDVILANNAALGGHVSVGDFAFLGGQSAVHQFIRVGEGAMIGGVTGVRGDVIPFGFALGAQANLVGLNVVGLRRRGVSREGIRRLRRAYRLIFLGEGQFAERVAVAAGEYGGDPLVGKIVDFICKKGIRPLMRPPLRREHDGIAEDVT